MLNAWSGQRDARCNFCKVLKVFCRFMLQREHKSFVISSSSFADLFALEKTLWKRQLILINFVSCILVYESGIKFKEHNLVKVAGMLRKLFQVQYK